MINTNNPSPGMSLSASFRYAISDIRHRVRMVSMPVLAIALGTGIFWIVAMYGYAFYRNQANLVAEQSLTYLSAMTEDIANADARFTESKLAEISARSDVRLAYPKVEIGVVLKSDQGGQLQITAEGIHPKDPRIAPAKMDWKWDRHGPSTEFVILDSATFAKLGGRVNAHTPRSASFTLQVTRVRDGNEERFEIPVRLAGVLSHRSGDRVFISQSLATKLDLFALNRSDKDSSTDHPEAGSEKGVAYVDAAQLDRLEEDAEYLGIRLEKIGEVETLSPAEDVSWARVTSSGDTDKTKALLEDMVDRFPGVSAWPETWQSLTYQGDVLQLVALGKEDPRWTRLKEGVPTLRQLVPVQNAYRGTRLGRHPFVARVGKPDANLPEGADLACTMETLAWLRFRPEQVPEVESIMLGRVDSNRDAIRLKNKGISVVSASPVAWGLYSVNSSDVRLSDLPQFSDTSEKSAAAFGPTWTTSWKIAPSLFSLNWERIRVRSIPKDVFEHMRGDKVDDEDTSGIAAVLVGSLPEGFPKTGVRAFHGNVRFLKQYPQVETGLDPEIWVSSAVAQDSTTEWEPGGVLVAGDWGAVMDVEDRLRTRESFQETARWFGLDRFWVLTSSERPEEDEVVNESVAAQWRVLTAKINGQSRYTLVDEDPETATALPEGIRRKLPGSATYLSPDAFYGGVFREYVQVDAFAGSVWSLLLPDPVAAKRIKAEVETSGARFDFTTPVRIKDTLIYSFEESDASSPAVNDRLISVVQMTRPTFVAAEQWPMDVQGTLHGESIRFRGSDAMSPHRFAAGLERGSWLTGREAMEVVLPVPHGPDVFITLDPVGSWTEVAFTRTNPVTHQAEHLNLRLKIQGYVSSSHGYISQNLSRDIRSWQENKRVFNPDAGAFETAAEAHARRGAIRASIVAASEKEVESLVTWLEGSDYRTDSRLGDMEALAKMRQTISILMGMIGVSNCLNAALMVGVTAKMNVLTKSYEIGLLKSLGNSNATISRIFLIQAVLIGLAGFGCASLLSIGLEGLVIRRGMTSVFGGDFEGIVGTMIGWEQHLILALAAFLIAILFSVAGMVMPTRSACRMMPTEALKGRH